MEDRNGTAALAVRWQELALFADKGAIIELELDPILRGCLGLFLGSAPLSLAKPGSDHICETDRMKSLINRALNWQQPRTEGSDGSTRSETLPARR